MAPASRLDPICEPQLAAGYLEGLGYKVVLCTMPLRTGSADWTAATKTKRTGYDDLVRANAAAADLVLDRASHPMMAAAEVNADNALCVDKLHHRRFGYQWLASAPSGTLQAAKLPRAASNPKGHQRRRVYVP